MKSQKLLDELEQKLAELEILKSVIKRIRKSVKFYNALTPHIKDEYAPTNINGVLFAFDDSFTEAFNDLETLLN